MSQQTFNLVKKQNKKQSTNDLNMEKDRNIGGLSLDINIQNGITKLKGLQKYTNKMNENIDNVVIDENSDFKKKNEIMKINNYKKNFNQQLLQNFQLGSGNDDIDLFHLKRFINITLNEGINIEDIRNKENDDLENKLAKTFSKMVKSRRLFNSEQKLNLITVTGISIGTSTIVISGIVFVGGWASLLAITGLTSFSQAFENDQVSAKRENLNNDIFKKVLQDGIEKYFKFNGIDIGSLIFPIVGFLFENANNIRACITIHSHIHNSIIRLNNNNWTPDAFKNELLAQTNVGEFINTFLSEQIAYAGIYFILSSTNSVYLPSLFGINLNKWYQQSLINKQNVPDLKDFKKIEDVFTNGDKLGAMFDFIRNNNFKESFYQSNDFLQKTQFGDKDGITKEIGKYLGNEIINFLLNNYVVGTIKSGISDASNKARNKIGLTDELLSWTYPDPKYINNDYDDDDEDDKEDDDKSDPSMYTKKQLIKQTNKFEKQLDRLSRSGVVSKAIAYPQYAVLKYYKLRVDVYERISEFDKLMWDVNSNNETYTETTLLALRPFFYAFTFNIITDSIKSGISKSSGLDIAYIENKGSFLTDFKMDPYIEKTFRETIQIFMEKLDKMDLYNYDITYLKKAGVLDKNNKISANKYSNVLENKFNDFKENEHFIENFRQTFMLFCMTGLNQAKGYYMSEQYLSTSLYETTKNISSYVTGVSKERQINQIKNMLEHIGKTRIPLSRSGEPGSGSDSADDSKRGKTSASDIKKEQDQQVSEQQVSEEIVVELDKIPNKLKDAYLKWNTKQEKPKVELDNWNEFCKTQIFNTAAGEIANTLMEDIASKFSKIEKLMDKKKRIQELNEEFDNDDIKSIKELLKDNTDFEKVFFPGLSEWNEGEITQDIHKTVLIGLINFDEYYRDKYAYDLTGNFIYSIPKNAMSFIYLFFNSMGTVAGNIYGTFEIFYKVITDMRGVIINLYKTLYDHKNISVNNAFFKTLEGIKTVYNSSVIKLFCDFIYDFISGIYKAFWERLNRAEFGRMRGIIDKEKYDHYINTLIKTTRTNLEGKKDKLTEQQKQENKKKHLNDLKNEVFMYICYNQPLFALKSSNNDVLNEAIKYLEEHQAFGGSDDVSYETQINSKYEKEYKQWQMDYLRSESFNWVSLEKKIDSSNQTNPLEKRPSKKSPPITPPREENPQKIKKDEWKNNIIEWNSNIMRKRAEEASHTAALKKAEEERRAVEKEEARKAQEEAKKVQEEAEARKAEEEAKKVQENVRKAQEEVKKVQEEARKAEEEAKKQKEKQIQEQKQKLKQNQKTLIKNKIVLKTKEMMKKLNIKCQGNETFIKGQKIPNVKCDDKDITEFISQLPAPFQLCALGNDKFCNIPNIDALYMQLNTVFGSYTNLVIKITGKMIDKLRVTGLTTGKDSGIAVKKALFKMIKMLGKSVIPGGVLAMVDDMSAAIETIFPMLKLLEDAWILYEIADKEKDHLKKLLEEQKQNITELSDINIQDASFEDKISKLNSKVEVTQLKFNSMKDHLSNKYEGYKKRNSDLECKNEKGESLEECKNFMYTPYLKEPAIAPSDDGFYKWVKEEQGKEEVKKKPYTIGEKTYNIVFSETGNIIKILDTAEDKTGLDSESAEKICENTDGEFCVSESSKIAFSKFWDYSSELDKGYTVKDFLLDKYKQHLLEKETSKESDETQSEPADLEVKEESLNEFTETLKSNEYKFEHTGDVITKINGREDLKELIPYIQEDNLIDILDDPKFTDEKLDNIIKKLEAIISDKQGFDEIKDQENFDTLITILKNIHRKKFKEVGYINLQDLLYSYVFQENNVNGKEEGQRNNDLINGLTSKVDNALKLVRGFNKSQEEAYKNNLLKLFESDDLREASEDLQLVDIYGEDLKSIKDLNSDQQEILTNNDFDSQYIKNNYTPNIVEVYYEKTRIENPEEKKNINDNLYLKLLEKKYKHYQNKLRENGYSETEINDFILSYGDFHAMRHLKNKHRETDESININNLKKEFNQQYNKYLKFFFKDNEIIPNDLENYDAWSTAGVEIPMLYVDTYREVFSSIYAKNTDKENLFDVKIFNWKPEEWECNPGNEDDCKNMKKDVLFYLTNYAVNESDQDIKKKLVEIYKSHGNQKSKIFQKYLNNLESSVKISGDKKLQHVKKVLLTNNNSFSSIMNKFGLMGSDLINAVPDEITTIKTDKQHNIQLYEKLDKARKSRKEKIKQFIDDFKPRREEEQMTEPDKKQLLDILVNKSYTELKTLKKNNIEGVNKGLLENVLEEVLNNDDKIGKWFEWEKEYKTPELLNYFSSYDGNDYYEYIKNFNRRFKTKKYGYEEQYSNLEESTQDSIGLKPEIIWSDFLNLSSAITKISQIVDYYVDNFVKEHIIKYINVIKNVKASRGNHENPDDINNLECQIKQKYENKPKGKEWDNEAWKTILDDEKYNIIPFGTLQNIKEKIENNAEFPACNRDYINKINREDYEKIFSDKMLKNTFSKISDKSWSGGVYTLGEGWGGFTQAAITDLKIGGDYSVDTKFKSDKLGHTAVLNLLAKIHMHSKNNKDSDYKDQYSDEYIEKFFLLGSDDITGNFITEGEFSKEIKKLKYKNSENSEYLKKIVNIDDIRKHVYLQFYALKMECFILNEKLKLLEQSKEPVEKQLLTQKTNSEMKQKVKKQLETRKKNLECEKINSNSLEIIQNIETYFMNIIGNDQSIQNHNISMRQITSLSGLYSLDNKVITGVGSAFSKGFSVGSSWIGSWSRSIYDQYILGMERDIDKSELSDDQFEHYTLDISLFI